MSEVKHTPLQRVGRYVLMRDEKPLRNLDDQVHGIHIGTEWEAVLYLSDLRSVVNSHGDLVEALRFYADPEAWNQPPVKTIANELLGPAYENQASKMQRDRGKLAREALSKVLELGEGL